MNPPDSVGRRRFLGQTASALLAGGLADSCLAADEPTAVPGIVDRLGRDVEAAPLAMRFAGSTAEDCRKWQKEFGTKLRELLGPFTPPTKWKTVVKSSADLDDHRRQELILSADGVPSLPVYLLLPRPKTAKKCAGVLALHGHGGYGHHPVAGRDDLPGVANAIKNNHYDYGRELVRRGYAVAVPCFTPFGDRLEKGQGVDKDLCGDTFIRLQMLGRLLMAENLRDALWALELLASQDEVDADRLGCVGLSLGGRMTMMTTAVQPRIKVAVVSGR